MTMTASDIDRDAPTRHGGLLSWVREVAELTTPERVVWCDGSAKEWRTLTDELVATGTLVPLDPTGRIAAANEEARKRWGAQAGMRLSAVLRHPPLLDAALFAGRDQGTRHDRPGGQPGQLGQARGSVGVVPG